MSNALLYEKNGWNWPNSPKSVWGPAGWYWLHMIAIAFPVRPTAKEKDITFRRILKFVSKLPCNECKTHAIQYCQQNLPTLQSSEDLQMWVVKFHNHVNDMLGKPIISFQSYRILYSKELREYRR
jgi:CCR4-NOT transcription complex subunit 1